MNVFRDVFVSYHSDSSLDIVKNTVELLEKFGISGWYAGRDVKATQNYADIVPIAINDCKLFVLILNCYSMKSLHVTREVNIAMDKRKTFLIINIDGTQCTDNQIIYASSANSQIEDIQESNINILSQKICQTILNWFNDNAEHICVDTDPANYKTTWDTNNLEFFGDVGERERIKVQHQFVYNFAKDAYLELLSNMNDVNFLDVGCHTGAQSKMFLKNISLKNYVGIDREASALEIAQQTFPDGHMYLCDCESKMFSSKLSEIELELGISGFDVINVSMLLLHMEKPAILIDILSDHLSDNGKIIILDIDDGFNIAYPDDDNMFSKAVQLCFKTEYSGFRHSGRTINKFLNDTDLCNVKLHKIGLSSIGMSRREKEYFFDMYFGFILDDLRKMHEESPSDQYIKADYDWLKENYDTMKNCFKRKDFFFNLGFVLYSAQL